MKPLVADADMWVRKAYRSFYLRPRKILEQIFQVRNFDDFKKNLDGLLGILSFKMREDAFTVVKKRTYNESDKKEQYSPYSSSPLIEINRLKDNLDDFERDIRKDDPSSGLPKI